jgi:hypothetical protein
MRAGSSIAATKARAVSWPTPGIVMSRRHAAEALAVRHMSASIAATAAITAARAAAKLCRAAETRDPFACLESLIVESGGERPRESDAEHDRKTADLVFQGHPLADQFLAGDSERIAWAGNDFTCTGLKNRCGPDAPERVVAIGLMGRKRFERLIRLPALREPS